MFRAILERRKAYPVKSDGWGTPSQAPQPPIPLKPPLPGYGLFVTAGKQPFLVGEGQVLDADTHQVVMRTGRRLPRYYAWNWDAQRQLLLTDPWVIRLRAWWRRMRAHLPKSGF